MSPHVARFRCYQSVNGADIHKGFPDSDSIPVIARIVISDIFYRIHFKSDCKNNRRTDTGVTIDLLNRNSELRGSALPRMHISNFLLRQVSYAELVITPTFWPDFRRPQLCAELEEYARRHRRFGGV